nr:UDP-N-acetylmuramoyl-L-alanine--D-glutamate ligase [Armatimonas sp.]
MRVAVLGLAATGLATARALVAEGAEVVLCDARPEEQLSFERVAEARALPGVTLWLGTTELPENLVLVVPSPGVPPTALPLLAAQARGIEISSEIEIAYRLASAPILAITGTNGKTTTAAMLGAICQAAGKNTYLAGNIAEDYGKRLPLIEAATQAPKDAVIIAEISSFQLEWVSSFRPRIAAWLNLSTDHLDRYATMSEYGQTKARIFAAQQHSDFAVVNADDRYVRCLSGGSGKGMRLPFHGEAPALAPALHLSPEELLVPGKHNLANAVAASAMGLAFGLNPLKIAEGLRGFRGVAHRMELVGEKHGVRFINNSMCTNPAAVAASLSALSGGVVAIAGGRHKGGDIQPMVEALAHHVRHVVLIGEHGPLLGDALAESGFTNTQQAHSLADAVQRAAAQARSGESVLLVPGFASFDMFTGFEQRGQVFRDAVEDLL